MNCTSAARVSTLTAIVSAGLAMTVPQTVSAQDHPVAPRGEFVQHTFDSGPLANIAAVDQVVFARVVQTDRALWTRLFFSDLVLEGESRIRYTSLLDGDVQEMGADEADMWQYTSAYLNGDAVLVELIAAPGTTQNRATLDYIEVEFLDGEDMATSMCGICFGSDDRVPSDEDYSGRVMSVGCSAAVYNPSSCIVSAGHCVGNFTVIQFRVPNSLPNCSIQHPSSIHQYPITNVVSHNGGVGNDWAVATTGISGGLTIYQRYGVFRPLATSVPSSGNIDVWGFGTSKTCVVSQTQQHSVGPIVGTPGNEIRHRADTTGGNSGSGIFFNDEIIGIVTHCWQPCPSNYNIGIKITQSAFQQAIHDLCPPIPPDPPANNECQNRIVIGDGVTPFTNEHATTDGPSEPTECTFLSNPQINHDIWYEYTTTCTGDLTVSLCDSDFNTKLGVYLGNICPTQDDTISACDTVSCPNAHSTLTMPVAEGETFIIRVGSRTIQMGEGNINIVCDEITQPTCPADFNGDGVVNVGDLLILFDAWGSCPGCPEDLNGDDVVNVADLLILFDAWGNCP
jgi:hypothetical protein